MRIHLKTTSNEYVVPFNYQPKLVGTLHKWLGINNEDHGNISLYSFSWLQKGEMVRTGFNFPDGACWFISFYDEDKMRQVVKRILENPEIFSGMVVSDVVIEETPDLSARRLFYLGSPIFIKQSDPDTGVRQYTFDDKEANGLMTQTLRHKMKMAGLPSDETLNVSFDLSYTKRRTKFLMYRGVSNRANMCPVLIDGKPETKAFAWNVGIGNSTGIGFGSIY